MKRTLYKTQCAYCNKELMRQRYRIIKGNCYCNARCQMTYEYANGIRDRNAIALKANASMRLNGNPKLKGKPSWNAGKVGRCPEFAMVGEKNPMYGKFGKAHPRYKTGASTGRKLAWSRSIYQNWRKAVFAKDDYICQMCGDDKGGNLHAHHIKSWAGFAEGRYDITNGITLCEICHTAIHKKSEKLHPMCRCVIVPIIEEF